MKTTILRKPAVLKATGLSKSTLYRQIATGAFPAPLRLGPRAVGWLESAVSAWVESRPRVGKGNDGDGQED